MLPFDAPAAMRRAAALWVLALAALVPVGAGGCAYYSFSGASVPEGMRTLAIPPVESNVALPVTSLPGDLGRLLVERFTQRTRLRLDDDPQTADAVLETRIETYRVEPTSVTAGDVAARSRLTLGVRVVFRRTNAPQGTAPLVDRTFSAFADFDPGALQAQREAEAAQTALRALADDVFTAATSNW